ncbi:ferredoxin [Haloechinothrix sp. LS1_15]|uniref:ferredoxin n=1 Tax=Haloechinothrix sp. LS1_15 TaxID=2652248 RepID=UPI0029482380|nr:ferredoxin [Haloechinothrix sp. LS1_15]MDV6014049.1 ferredoxin [Haloechinothrix sp. LS1_15]
MMRIEADRTKCEGLGMCEAMAPDHFEVGDDGTVVVLNEQPDEEHRTELTAAVDACPVLALALRG